LHLWGWSDYGKKKVIQGMPSSNSRQTQKTEILLKYGQITYLNPCRSPSLFCVSVPGHFPGKSGIHQAHMKIDIRLA
jgi:hypothetical protein